MRLSYREISALRKALEGVKGKVYLYGSRLNDKAKGGDIDILVIPYDNNNINYKPGYDIERKFMWELEQSIDVTLYRDNPFCKEVLKNAELIYDSNTQRTI